MIKLLLVWFVAVNTPADLQPRAILTTDCMKASDRYTADMPTIPDAAWRYRCTSIPTISQLEAALRCHSGVAVMLPRTRRLVVDPLIWQLPKHFLLR